MTVHDFKMLAKVENVGVEMGDFSKVEDDFWNDKIKEEKIYSINNSVSLFGDEVKVWNLDKFTKDDSCIHSKPSHRFLKVSC